MDMNMNMLGSRVGSRGGGCGCEDDEEEMPARENKATTSSKPTQRAKQQRQNLVPARLTPKISIQRKLRIIPQE
jgi:hypothetical protein